MSQINESTIATPGVYVTEIPSFPPSIAQVATAIPAFVGYTAKADNLQPGDLNLVPTRLSSMVEYQQYFGNGPDPGITEVDIDLNNIVTGVKRNATYYMYDSIRMFFLNGGSTCYIVSIGEFPTAPNPPSYDKTDFENGLDALRKYDEPTLLLFPDAVLLGADLYTVQNYALKQCGDLQDRFSILDLLEPASWPNGVTDFRNSTGVENLNYGAAYAPYLKTNLGLSVVYGNLQNKIFQAGSPIDLKNFTSSTDAQNLITSMNNLILDTTTVQNTVKALFTGHNLDLAEQWQFLVNEYQTSFDSTVTPPTDDEPKFEALVTFLYTVAKVVDTWAAAAGANRVLGDSAGAGLKQDILNIITSSLIATMTKVLHYDEAADTLFTAGAYYTAHHTVITSFTDATWGHIFTAASAPDASIYVGANLPSKRLHAVPTFTTLFNQLNKGVAQILSLLGTYQANYEQSLLQTHPVYKQIVNVVKNAATTLPPSGAIAGVYASVDATRGVWKAPANVSLTGVTALTYNIDDPTQGGLNIDAMSGKSINAIRAFTGKGILVWGARTLDGNSNDFRYISVRRFLINVEESVKMASMQFVFEPNDGNTWVRIRAMIENYLTNLWRLGALAGSKPEQSFYVKVGLGQTMIFDDILNGKMIIEVGLAPVRPAEFIILRFSQIQQQA
ncbi:MAG: phage tail sheath subtilisin-like domain-containing protein [Bacteroidota bacterium]|nr:phage tail sheath subtilisin-like domain-containing protein [Bacteroidota bacterium]